jgi:RNA polymerase primary sigma factor
MAEAVFGSVEGEPFAAAVDRAAGSSSEFRRRGRLPVGESATGADVERRLRRLEAVEPTSYEMTRLAERAQLGDAASLDRLVQRALPLVVRTARRYAGQDVELADLIQEGVLGLLRAVERFDVSRGVPFSAYAGWWLRQALQQVIAEQSRSLRVPTHVLWDIHHIREARDEIRRESGREAGAVDLERRLGWSAGRVDDVLRVERPAMRLDAAYPGDASEVDNLGDLLVDPLSEQAYQDVVTRITSESVRALLSTLTEREQQVLGWRMGLDGDELSLRQIGRRLGMSAERVRQIEQRALLKLRQLAVPNPG